MWKGPETVQQSDILDELAGVVRLRSGARFSVRKYTTVHGMEHSISLNDSSSRATDEELARIAQMVGRVRMG